jgi:hypothetical protein
MIIHNIRGCLDLSSKRFQANTWGLQSVREMIRYTKLGSVFELNPAKMGMLTSQK